MLFGNFSLEMILVNLVVLGIGMTIHEFAHNYVAHLAGDPMPQKWGRLTLNPFVHINWIGWLMFAIIGFGILGSAPISYQRMQNGRWGPRWGYLFSVAAGPLSNLVLAILVGIVVQLAGIPIIPFGSGANLIGLFIFQMVFLNVLLFFFNIIPLFPLDGWSIVWSLLPPDLAYRWQANQQNSYYVFIGLLIYTFSLSYLAISFLPDILNILVGQPTIQLTFTLLGF